MEIIIGDKIGEGNFRQCYEIVGTDLCTKRAKKHIMKEIFGRTIYLNASIYSLLKFGATNLNKIEYKAIKSLPKELIPYLPAKISLTDDDLIMERSKDFDGSYSRIAIDNGLINNDAFWKHVTHIVTVLEENKVFPSDVFRNGNNVIVKRVSEEEWMPVLIDFKRIGYRSDPFQFNLLLKSEQSKKFHRRLLEFHKRFDPKFQEPSSEAANKNIADSI